MTRILEAAAPSNLTAFTIEVIAGGVVVETIVMANIAAEGPTWQGEIANALSVGLVKLNFFYNAAPVASGRYHANISPDDGSISYARDYVYSDVVVDSSSGGDPGARTVLVTVVDEDTLLPIENAKVRLSSGTNTRVKPTDVNGNVTFNVDDATWTVAITAFGYTFDGATLVVSSDVTITYELNPITAAIPPTEPQFCVLKIRVWTIDGSPAEGVEVKVQVEEAPAGTGEIFSKAVQTQETASDGYATFVVPRGCELKYWVGEVEESVDQIGTLEDIVYLENQLGLPIAAI